MSTIDFEINKECCRVITPSQLPPDKNWISYSLYIRVDEIEYIRVGKLGSFRFAPGDYIYSGSARRGICARVNRHLRQEKKLRWHIDYLLAAPSVQITRVRLSTASECRLVAEGGGAVVVSGFGASDCSNSCGSHLRCLSC